MPQTSGTERRTPKRSAVSSPPPPPPSSSVAASTARSGARPPPWFVRSWPWRHVAGDLELEPWNFRSGVTTGGRGHVEHAVKALADDAATSADAATHAYARVILEGPASRV